MSDGPAVTIAREGAVAILTMDRAASRNAIDDEMADALVNACALLGADVTIGCAVLFANGPAFCAGGNVKDMHAGRGMFAGSPAQMRSSYRTGIQRVPRAFHDLETPIVAAVNGPAVGAGFDLALMCDLRVAAEGATFAESFVRLGLVSGDGGAWWLPRVIGAARAAQMTLTGDPIDARQAADWGIVSQVCPAERLREEALALARRVACHPPLSLRLNKRLLRESERLTLAQSLELAAGLQSIVQHTADQREAVDAFVTRREPRFRGE